jgi:hypothetical protein
MKFLLLCFSSIFLFISADFKIYFSGKDNKNNDPKEYVLRATILEESMRALSLIKTLRKLNESDFGNKIEIVSACKEFMLEAMKFDSNIGGERLIPKQEKDTLDFIANNTNFTLNIDRGDKNFIKLNMDQVKNTTNISSEWFSLSESFDTKNNEDLKRLTNLMKKIKESSIEWFWLTSFFANHVHPIAGNAQSCFGVILLNNLFNLNNLLNVDSYDSKTYGINSRTISNFLIEYNRTPDLNGGALAYFWGWISKENFFRFGADIYTQALYGNSSVRFFVSTPIYFNLLFKNNINLGLNLGVSGCGGFQIDIDPSGGEIEVIKAYLSKYYGIGLLYNVGVSMGWHHIFKNNYKFYTDGVFTYCRSSPLDLTSFIKIIDPRYKYGIGTNHYSLMYNLGIHMPLGSMFSINTNTGVNFFLEDAATRVYPFVGITFGISKKPRTSYGTNIRFEVVPIPSSLFFRASLYFQ